MLSRIPSALMSRAVVRPRVALVAASRTKTTGTTPSRSFATAALSETPLPKPLVAGGTPPPPAPQNCCRGWKHSEYHPNHRYYGPKRVVGKVATLGLVGYGGYYYGAKCGTGTNEKIAASTTTTSNIGDGGGGGGNKQS